MTTINYKEEYEKYKSKYEEYHSKYWKKHHETKSLICENLELQKKVDIYESVVLNGIVKRLSNYMDYGIITTHKYGDIFFHSSQCKFNMNTNLIGKKVKFNLMISKRLEAINLELEINDTLSAFDILDSGIYKQNSLQVDEISDNNSDISHESFNSCIEEVEEKEENKELNEFVETEYNKFLELEEKEEFIKNLIKKSFKKKTEKTTTTKEKSKNIYSENEQLLCGKCYSLVWVNSKRVIQCNEECENGELLCGKHLKEIKKHKLIKNGCIGVFGSWWNYESILERRIGNKDHLKWCKNFYGKGEITTTWNEEEKEKLGKYFWFCEKEEEKVEEVEDLISEIKISNDILPEDNLDKDIKIIQNARKIWYMNYRTHQENKGWFNMIDNGFVCTWQKGIANKRLFDKLVIGDIIAWYTIGIGYSAILRVKDKCNYITDDDLRIWHKTEEELKGHHEWAKKHKCRIIKIPVEFLSYTDLYNCINRQPGWTNDDWTSGFRGPNAILPTHSRWKEQVIKMYKCMKNNP